MPPINLVADENILLLDEFFGDLAQITRVNGRSIDSEQVVHADALVLRSTAKVTPALLKGSKVQFVGTCTIGTDHLATDYMDTNNIVWRNAPGCNAAGVGDYVIACLNHAWQTLGVDPRQQTIGIVGAGNVGGRLAQRLHKAGFNLLQCDPPKVDAGHEGYVELDELLGRCQIVCLHTPLTKTGGHATENLLNQTRVKNLAKGTVLISAGRGEVVDQQALLERQQKHNDLHLFMDVWHQEPDIDKRLFDYCHCVTPHIAGHSLEGKMRGTSMIYQSLCEHFGLPASLRVEDLIPQPDLARLQINPAATAQEVIAAACSSVYPLMEDNARMRQSNDFDLLRKNYPVRREFSSLQLQGITNSECAAMMGGLGFGIEHETH
ncbi:4-phosphoerythronate dehydrogenase [Candidatus Njordibacter sp. Uisw_039]|uniref:4-phosphoerythronate dehydrogenase n=1 Tax=Candidatus Njordibacter sp. Uisw_039 TaxID=3230972 RepID=UPI003D4CBF9C